MVKLAPFLSFRGSSDWQRMLNQRQGFLQGVWNPFVWRSGRYNPNNPTTAKKETYFQFGFIFVRIKNILTCWNLLLKMQTKKFTKYLNLNTPIRNPFVSHLASKFQELFLTFINNNRTVLYFIWLFKTIIQNKRNSESFCDKQFAFLQHQKSKINFSIAGGKDVLLFILPLQRSCFTYQV